MDGQISTFTIALLISVGVSTAVAIFVQRWREVSGVKAFTIRMISQVVWTLGFVLEIFSPDLATKLLFHKIAWIGVFGAPIAWMVFTFRYTRHDAWMNRRMVALIGLVPLLLWAAAATNDLHHLFWSSTVLDSQAAIGVLYGHGPLFWVAVGYIYVLLFSAFVGLIWVTVQSPLFYRRQSIFLITAGAAPLVTNLAFLAGFSGKNDYTPIAFMVTGLFVTWAIFRYRLFNLVPVARGHLLETLPDGVLVLDAQNRVIDTNPALLKMIDHAPLSIGEPVDRLFEASPSLYNNLQEGEIASGRIVSEPLSGRNFELTISVLDIRPGYPKGRLIVFRDVTEREKASRALVVNEENFRKIFDANPFPVGIVGVEHTFIYQANQALLDYVHMTREQLIGLKASSFYADPQMADLLREEIDQNGAVRDRVVELRFPNGELHLVQLNASCIDYYGEERYMVGFVDVTARQKSDDYERSQRILAEALRDTASMITSTLNLEEVLDRILECTSRVVHYEVANILMVDEDRIAYVARTRGYAEMGIDSPFGKVWLSIDHTPTMRWMIQNRLPLMIRDTSKDPDWILVEGQDWIRGHLGAPIFTQEGITGFINLDSSIPGYFSQNDAERLQIFADQAGIAIQNARLYSGIQKAGQEAEVLQSIAQAVSSSLDFDKVIRRIFDLIGRLMPSDSAGVLLIDGNEVVLRYFRGMENSEDLIGTRWQLAGTANEQVLKERRPIIFADVQAFFPGYRVPPHNQIRSILMIPLFAGGQVIGFLSLDSWVLNHFTTEDERLAVAYSSAIAVALENARLYDESQRRLKVESILNEVSRAISSRQDLSSMLDLIWRQIARFIDAAYFLISGVAGEQGRWAVLYAREANERISNQTFGQPTEAASYVFQTGRAMFLRTRAEVELFSQITGLKLRHADTRSLMGVPLQVFERSIGVMRVLSITRDFAYSQADFELFTSIASQVSVSIENASLFEEARRRAAELEILNRVGLAVTSGLDLEHVLMALFDQVRLVMPADTFYVALYERESGRIEFPLFYDAGVYRSIPVNNLNDSGGMTGWIIREGKTLVLEDSLTPEIEGKYQIIRLGGIQTRAIIGVPMFLRDQIAGVISVQNQNPGVFSMEQVHLLETIATQAAIAIENARLYQEAQILAREDFLTGLLNRRELFIRAEEEFERARRYRHDLAIMMVDVDRFKLVNDSYGHQVGDQMLSALSEICKRNMRLVDVVGRYGGEEILILMPETDDQAALVAAERLRKEVEELKVEADGENVSVTVSIGVAIMSRARGFTLEMLISRADKALFRSKDAGRNCVCFYQEESSD